MLHGRICRAGMVAQPSAEFCLWPFPCPSGPGHKARALKHTGSRYLLVLVGPCVWGSPDHREEGVEGSESS